MIKKWKIDKKVKGREMQHVVRIRRRRQSGTFPRKTKFRVRDRTVDQAKIDRFEREHTILSKLSSSKCSVRRKRHSFNVSRNAECDQLPLSHT